MDYGASCMMADAEMFLEGQAEVFGGKDDGEGYSKRTKCYYKNRKFYSKSFFKSLAKGLVYIIQGEPLIGIVGWVEKSLMNSGFRDHRKL